MQKHTQKNKKQQQQTHIIIQEIQENSLVNCFIFESIIESKNYRIFFVLTFVGTTTDV